MRKELELMETIENYIKGNLSDLDKTAFENRMNTEPGLKKEVELQKELMKGIERTGLKQSVQQAAKKYKFKKNVKNWGLGGLTVAVIALSSLFIYKAQTKSNSIENVNILPELNEQGEKIWSDADKYLKPQQFELNTEKDTVVETKDGIVFAIPANSFVDASGKPAKGNIQLEVKEALKAADIMKAGLTTKSGSKLLETGGMFYVNARQNGASLKIDPKNPLHAEVPTNEVKPGMQLFEGKRLPNGSIDWVNPKPIQKDLIPVDILSLNFYPPGYLDSLRKWKYNSSDKQFTDSLYYSFASLFGSNVLNNQTGAKRMLTDSIEFTESMGSRLFNGDCAVCHSLGKNKKVGPGLAGVMNRVPNEEWLFKYIKNNELLEKQGDPYTLKIKQHDAVAMPVYASLSYEQIKSIIDYIKQMDISETVPALDDIPVIPGINPAKINAIWDEKFQNTLLATHEFEERLPYIFGTCSNEVLDLYINNLDKNLSVIDSMVARMEIAGNNKFQEFAARGDGKVKNGNTVVRLLKAYYEQRTKRLTETVAKTVKEFWEKQTEADRKAFENRSDRTVSEMNRLSENLAKEFDLNLTAAYRQLGREKPQAAPPATYDVTVTTTGWCNVDKYVDDATTNRQTLDYTDKETGKKATIKYEPLTVSVNEMNTYDRVMVYLLPDELNSFMRMEQGKDVFEEKLNELMLYKLVCIAYKGDKAYYYSQDNVKPGKLSVSLIETSNASIQNNVNKLSNANQIKAMNDELNYMTFEKDEMKRVLKVQQIQGLTNKIRPVIFPCLVAK